MKLNNRALMTSGGFGAAINILVQLCTGSVGFAPLAGPDLALALVGLTGMVGVVACLCGGLVAIGIGFSYVFFAKRDGPVEMGDGAAGGAIANGVAGLLGGLVGACLLVVAPLAVSAGSGAELDVASAVGGGIGGIAGAVCGGLIGGAIFGAIGGVIGAATVGKQA